MLTPGENYYCLFEEKIPEYIPIFMMMPFPGYTPALVMSNPSIHSFHGPNGGIDPWGVKYISSEEAGNAAMPQTWDYILEDINDWEKIIKNPDLSAVDWKTMAEKDNEFLTNVLKVDRSQSLVLSAVDGQFFQNLMAFMGFEEGLCAMMEEPEQVKRLNEYELEYYLEFQHKVIEYYSPDVIYLLDDTAAKLCPFVSEGMFDELLLPFYTALIDDAKAHGLPVQFHNCGHSETFMMKLSEAGVRVWDPAQTTNDLLAVKEKMGRKLALAGCWDWVPPATYPEVDEQEIRRQVRETIDKYAAGGGFAVTGGGSIVARVGDETPKKIRNWMLDEATTYGADYYKLHPEKKFSPIKVIK